MSRPPLVYLAESVRENAVALIGEVPENALAKLIAAGSLTGRTDKGYVVGEGWRAAFVRRPGKHRPRPLVWLIHAVEKCSECGRQRSR